MTDVIVIGAGHNGLVCAGLLAKAGMDVLILEASSQTGGMCVTREFAPGFKAPSVAHLVGSLAPNLAETFDLVAHGLQWANRDVRSVALSSEGDCREFFGSQVEGGGISASEQAAFADFSAQMDRFADVLAKVSSMAPPKLVEGGLADRVALLKLGWHVRGLGKSDVRELLRVGTMNLYDLLNERLDDNLLKGAIAMDGVLGTHLGPRSPNTVLTYLQRRLYAQAGAFGLPVGGAGAVSAALTAAVGSLGVQIRTSAEVEEILVTNDRVEGVRLVGGERIAATTVISSADPHSTFSGLVGLHHLNTGFARRVSNYRTRGNAAKLHLGLKAVPTFVGLSEAKLQERLLIAPDLGYVERAFNHAKYSEFSPEPVMEITIPSLADERLAPEGSHVLSAVVQYAPLAVKDGWPQQKLAFAREVMRTLERYAPGISDLVEHFELLTPEDLQAQFRVTGGHWHHGEFSLDQFMMMRPFPGAARYATPVRGLYLCGAGTHPGGGVLGLAGHNAALAVRKNMEADG